jgi:hypothetical protein
MRSQVLCLAAMAIVAVSSCNTKEKSASAKKDFLTDNLDTTMSPAQIFFNMPMAVGSNEILYRQRKVLGRR